MGSVVQGEGEGDVKRNEKLDSETRLKGTPEKEREDEAALA